MTALEKAIALLAKTHPSFYIDAFAKSPPVDQLLKLKDIKRQYKVTLYPKSAIHRVLLGRQADSPLADYSVELDEVERWENAVTVIKNAISELQGASRND